MTTIASTAPDRPRWRQISPPVVSALLALVVVAEVAWAALVLAGSDDLVPHAVPAVVVGDPVVAESVARQYDDLPGDPFDLRAVTNEDTLDAAIRDRVE